MAIVVSRHRYWATTREFGFASHVFSATCDRFLRGVLDLPSEQILRHLSSSPLAQIEAYLSDVEGALAIIS
jgi:hypothetical protein